MGVGGMNSWLHRLSKAWLALLGLAVLNLPAAESPGKFGFHIFPPANGQNLGFASRPVSDGRGGFWFYAEGRIWRFDARGYRVLGPEDGFPKGRTWPVYPEPSTGMWFHAEKAWFNLGHGGLHSMPAIPEPDAKANRQFLPIRNEGLGVVAEGKLRIFGPPGQAMVELPIPGTGTWIKGWKDPKSPERLIVGDLGLARWDGRSWEIQSLVGLLDGRGWDVLRVRSGALWVRSDRDMARVEPSPARFGPRLDFTRNSFVTMEEDSFGRVWTNGPEGLACVDSERIWRIGEREGLYGYHSYWPIAFDRQGCLWTISALGFQRLKGAFLWSVQERPQGLPRAMIFNVQRLPRDGRLFAGTHDGLYRRGQERWEMLPGTDRWGLFAVAERANGEIWCGGNPPDAHYQTVLRIRPGQPAVRPVIQGYPSGKWTGDLCWETENILWARTDEALFRIEARGGSFTAVREALPGIDPDEGPNWVGFGPDRSLWVATDVGLFLRQGSTWRRFTQADGLAAEDAVRAFPGPDGEFWVIHSDSKAISRLSNRPGKGWTVVGTLPKGHPLMVNGGSGGWTDPQGHVWIQTKNDVVRWDGQRAEHHSVAFGLPIDTLWSGSIYGERDGHMFIGSVSGLICFEPRFYQPLPGPPAVEAGEARTGSGEAFGPGTAIPFRKTGVAFGLMLPLVDGVEDLRCETRLVGLDEEWRTLDGHLLRFPGLPPGRYVLEARAARRDGLYGPVFTFPFTILRPWYLRLWALLAWTVLLGSVTALFLRWRTWTLRREQARLEGLVAQRTSDLVQANETLVQTLAEVKTLKGLVPICCYCKKIRDDAGFWNQIERYIQDHSDAKFSHGICPDCERHVREELEAENLLRKRE
jgi:hypothetical protein